jgi:hypothetical protein
MTKSHARRTETGYKANVGGATQPGMGTPHGHSDASMVNPAGGGEEGKPYLRRSRSWSMHDGLPREKSQGMGAEKSAEAIVVAAPKGPLRRAESSIAGSRLKEPMTDSAGNSATALGWRGPRRSGEAEPTCCVGGGSCRSRHPTATGPWRHLPLNQSEKPPYTTSTYGGVGGRGREAPPTRFCGGSGGLFQQASS